jgi:hypothetical protein
MPTSPPPAIPPVRGGLPMSVRELYDDKTGPDQKRPDQTRPDQTRQDKTRQERTRQDKTRQDKKRQDKTRQDITRPDKTRQDKTRQDKFFQSRHTRRRSLRLSRLPWCKADSTLFLLDANMLSNMLTSSSNSAHYPQQQQTASIRQ